MKKYVFSPKQTFLLLIFFILFVKGFAQQDTHMTGLDQDHFNSTQAIYSLTANRLPSGDKLGESFLFNANWVSGVVYFKSGKQYNDGKLQFDIYKNELHFNNNGEANVFAEPVLRFTLVDTTKGAAGLAVFRCTYPATGMKSEKTFYQVLATGPNVHLVKYLSEKSEDIYQYSMASKTVYSVKEDWYVYDVKNNKLQWINKSASSIEKALPIYAARIEELLKGKNGKRLGDDEIVILTNKLNELGQN